MKTILQSEYYTGSLDEENQIIVLKRSAQPFKDPEAMLKSLDEVLRMAKSEGADSWPMLADQRDAPAPTSERYRIMFREMGKQMSQRFAYIAVLLESQESVDRILESVEERDDAGFFSDKDEAISALKKMREG